MYLPENDNQMFDILGELRLYASLNKLPGLAEKLDDALVTLVVERSRATALAAQSAPATDRR